VELELLTHLEHLNSTPDFSGVRVARSLAFCVVLYRVVCSFVFCSYGHCIDCS
jgi:hypothetical protein